MMRAKRPLTWTMERAVEENENLAGVGEEGAGGGGMRGGGACGGGDSDRVAGVLVTAGGWLIGAWAHASDAIAMYVMLQQKKFLMSVCSLGVSRRGRDAGVTGCWLVQRS